MEDSAKYIILVVDDSWITRQFMTNLLDIKGFIVKEAGNGIEAMKQVEEQVPDCILLDVLMPEMDGIETLKALKEAKYSIPTIMLSADIQATTRAQAYRYGAIDFINKPAKDVEILSKIEKALKGSTE